jgi:hypothetical protein
MNWKYRQLLNMIWFVYITLGRDSRSEMSQLESTEFSYDQSESTNQIL